MEVNFIEASEKLKSALERIEKRIGEIENRPDEEYMFLVEIQRDLKSVEIIETSDKLKSVLGRIEKRIDEFENRIVKNGIECRNLVKIQTDLERVKKLLIDVETGNLWS